MLWYKAVRYIIKQAVQTYFKKPFLKPTCDIQMLKTNLTVTEHSGIIVTKNLDVETTILQYATRYH